MNIEIKGSTLKSATMMLKNINKIGGSEAPYIFCDSFCDSLGSELPTV